MGVVAYMTLTASGPAPQVQQLRGLIDNHTDATDQSDYTDFQSMLPGVPKVSGGFRSFELEQKADDSNVIWMGSMSDWPIAIPTALSKRFRCTAITMKFEYLWDTRLESDCSETHTIKFKDGKQELLYHMQGCHEFDPTSLKETDHWRMSFLFDNDAQEETIMGILEEERSLKGALPNTNHVNLPKRSLP